MSSKASTKAKTTSSGSISQTITTADIPTVTSGTASLSKNQKRRLKKKQNGSVSKGNIGAVSGIEQHPPLQVENKPNDSASNNDSSNKNDTVSITAATQSKEELLKELSGVAEDVKHSSQHSDSFDDLTRIAKTTTISFDGASPPALRSSAVAPSSSTGSTGSVLSSSSSSSSYTTPLYTNRLAHLDAGDDDDDDDEEDEDEEDDDEESVVDNDDEQQGSAVDQGLAAGQPFVLLVPVMNGAATVDVKQMIFYTGVDKHIHCLSSDNDKEWQHINITAQLSGNLLASGDPTARISPSSNAVVVGYRGDDGELHQLRSTDDGKTWQHLNVTLASQTEHKEFGELPSVARVSSAPSEIPKSRKPMEHSSSAPEVIASTEEGANAEVVPAPMGRSRSKTSAEGLPPMLAENNKAEVFKVKAYINRDGIGESTVTIPCTPATSVGELIRKVLRKFPEGVDQFDYCLYVNDEWMDDSKKLFEYQTQLKRAKNSLEMKKVDVLSSPKVDRRSGAGSNTSIHASIRGPKTNTLTPPGQAGTVKFTRSPSMRK